MPKYGQLRFGSIGRYGKYSLVTPNKGAIGPHVRYKIRLHSPTGEVTDYLTMLEDRTTISRTLPNTRVRLRANDGEWVYTQSETIAKETFKVRIRSLDGQGSPSEWVYSDRASLRKQ